MCKHPFRCEEPVLGNTVLRMEPHLKVAPITALASVLLLLLLLLLD